MNGGKLAKLVMQPETDVGSELLLTSFDVTHHGQSTSHPDIKERERERQRGRETETGRDREGERERQTHREQDGELEAFN